LASKDGTSRSTDHFIQKASDERNETKMTAKKLLSELKIGSGMTRPFLVTMPQTLPMRKGKTCPLQPLPS
jgi:hypothetical protein